ncbi:hypothetical protein AB0L71_25330 [Streptomyces sp. NPDC052052]|uniref:hypothetical protein n=1 Tax=Streptomyces sp. NPDC052052 TaxID=3154756 RepID=UPI0034279C84
MEALVNVVIIIVMIALAAFVIHRLNTRHRHQHLRPAHYDHGLVGFGEGPDVRAAPGPGPEPVTGERRGSGEPGGSGGPETSRSAE